MPDPADPVTRTAARTAALVAVPLAALAGVAAFLLLGGTGGVVAPAAAPTGSPTTSPPPAAVPAATGPVETTAGPLTEWEEIVCRALLSQLPDALRDAAQRPVTAGAEQNAAYGDPPITVVCGAAPAAYPPTDPVWPVAGVCWHAAGQPDGATVWVTLDREVPVAVTVPAGYDPPVAWVTGVAGTVATTVRSGGDPPSGCR